MYRVTQPVLPAAVADLAIAKQRVCDAYTVWLAATRRDRRELERQRSRVATVIDGVHARHSLAHAMMFASDWEQYARLKARRAALT